MKAMKEQMDGELVVIKLFASNYARDLVKRKRISEYVIDKTQLKVGAECIRLWVAIIESKN